MKIGLISDTHGYIDAWQRALEIFGEVELILHAGDILSSGPCNPITESYQPNKLLKIINASQTPIIFAKGNCDAEVDGHFLDYPIEAPYAFVYIDGLRIMVTHGHLADDSGLADLGNRYKTDIIIRGHSHERGILQMGNLYLVNPGSASIPMNEDKIPSVGIIENGLISILSLHDGSVLEQNKHS